VLEQRLVQLRSEILLELHGISPVQIDEYATRVIVAPVDGDEQLDAVAPAVGRGDSQYPYFVVQAADDRLGNGSHFMRWQTHTAFRSGFEDHLYHTSSD
jgi:hypothetical protein